MNKTSIQWTDLTWNVVTGCTKVSQGCAHCYAETIAERFWGERKFSDVHIHPERLEQPLHWRKPSRIFVNSMSDLFHEDIPITFIAQIFAVMTIAKEHTFQILTKRPERMLKILGNLSFDNELEAWQELLCHDRGYCPQEFDWPLPNVWLGTSIEDQKTADERTPLLLQTPAAVRFVSAEPLLGEIELQGWDGILQRNYLDHGFKGDRRSRGPLDWVICGGESGPGARPMHPDWARSLRDQCQEAGVAYFFKQWGEYIEAGRQVDLEGNWITTSTVMQRVGKKAAGRLLDGLEWSGFPGGQP